MEITSKQRAKLRAIASGEATIFQIGKAGLSDDLIKQLDNALVKREIIKIKALETSPEAIGEMAEILAEKTNSVIVQTIGNKLVLYKRNVKNPVIKL